MEDLEEEILGYMKELEQIKQEIKNAQEIMDRVEGGQDDLDERKTELDKAQSLATQQRRMLQVCIINYMSPARKLLRCTY